MDKEMEEWERESGARFLRRVGLRSGQRVLDFGAGIGHYSIPAAIIVGKKGIVYALDKDMSSLNKLQRKATKRGLENIRFIKSEGSLKIDLGNNSLDSVMAYDILHLIDNRKKLYGEVYRVLIQNGLFSVYPKHNKLDAPGWGLENMTPENIKIEIENYGFNFKKEYCGVISHDDSLNKGCVLNFRKNRAN